MVNSGAGLLIPQPEFTTDQVSATLQDLLKDRAKLLDMAVAAESIGVTNASQVIAQACLEYVPQGSAS